jgi:hypothetical protein
MVAGSVATHTVAARNARDIASVDEAALPHPKLDRAFMEVPTVGSIAEVDDSLGDVVGMVDGVEVRVGFLVMALPEVSTRTYRVGASAVTRAGGFQRSCHRSSIS